MDDLVRWLGVQLDADAARATAAAEEGGPEWRYDGDAVVTHRERDLVAIGSQDYMEAERGEFIAEHDPARVLREVEAKRQLLALHVITVEKADVPPFDPYTGERNPDEYNVTCVLCGWASDDRSSACLTLRLLALPYAGRDGYRPEWAPSE